MIADIFTQSDNDKAGWLGTTLRTFLSMFDRGVYFLLVVMYQIFFNVASAQILQGATLKAFYSRVQLILGIFILFKLAINLLNVIVNPDNFSGSKSDQGFTKIVTRIITALVMLVVIMPINIPDAAEGSYEANINANGLLFGTMYEFQDRILEGNTLAKLIIGSPISSGSDERNNMKDAGNQLSSIVLKGFIRINLAPGKTNEKEPEDRMCPDEEEDIKEYLDANVAPGAILDMITHTCKHEGEERFVFTYTPFVGAVIGALFVFVIVGFTLDIAIRAIKLAILRLIAPIPIISYIDPKSSKDGAFASWTKAVIKTYLDLFLRLAIVYFVIFVVQDIIKNGIIIDTMGGIIGTISTIFIFLGLLFFAKQAPKFIMDTLGIKGGGMSNIGLSGMLGGTAMALGGGGLSGFALGAMQGSTGAADAAAQGKSFSPGNAWSQNRDQMAKIRTGDKDARGGIVGGLMDRSLYGARERQLGKKGLSAENVEAAKMNYYDQQEKVHALERQKEFSGQRLKNLGVTSDPGQAISRDDWLQDANNMGYNEQGPYLKSYDDYLASHNEKVEAWATDQANDAKLETEKARLGKIEKNYKDGSGAREAMATKPTLRDEYTARGYRKGGGHEKFNSNKNMPGEKAGETDGLDDINSDRLGGEIGHS